MSIFVQFVLIAQVIVFFLNLFLGFVVIRANRNSKINQLFGIYAASLAFWNIALFFTITGIGGTTIQLWWSRLAFSFYLLMINSFLYFVLIYPNVRVKSLLNVFFWALTAILFFLTLTPWLIQGNIKIFDGSITGDFGPLIMFFSLYYTVLIVMGLVILLWKFFRNQNILRDKFLYLLFGFSIFGVPMVLTNMVLPVFFGIFKYNNLGPLFSLPMLAIIGYAIVRHHLMDVRFILRIGTIYAFLFAVIGFVFVLSSSLVSNYLDGSWSYIMPSIIIVIGFSPLKNLLESATDEIFFRKKYKFIDVINKSEEIIHSAGLNLDGILNKFNRIIVDALKIDKAAILILIPKGHFITRQIIGDGVVNFEVKFDNPIINYFGSGKREILDKEELISEINNDSFDKQSNEIIATEFDRLGFSLALPIKVKDKLIGIYLFGQKRSQYPFNDEDVRLLKHTIGEIGFTIDNARMFEELEVLDHAKSEFISVVSHQLRTPVSIIRWNLELILDKGMSAKEKKKSLQMAYDSLISLNYQLDQLMITLDIGEKKMSLSVEKCNVNELIKKTVKSMSDKIKNKRLVVGVDLNKCASEINCDPLKIEKVLDIMISNAVLYTPEGGSIEINSCKKQLDGKNNIVVSVADNGLGIQEENKADIFKKFFRSESAKNVSPNGLGMGLFIAKNFINAHGGNMWFESPDPLKGSIFYFSLPVE